MRFMNMARAFLLSVFGILWLTLAACQGAAVATPTAEADPTVAPVLKVYAASITPPSFIEAKYTSPAVMTFTVERVREIAAESPALVGSKHLAAGVECESCHTTFPPTAAPSRETCLGCHEAEYKEIAAIPSKRNPHNNHLGAIPCVDCHHAHVPYESTCLQCHLEPCDCSLR